MHAGLTMESLRDLLHKKQADLLEEASNDETSDAEMSAASDRVQEMLLSTRMPSLTAILNNTRVDTSTIPNAGRGLFATRTIQANEVITCYPGDAVLTSKPSVAGDFHVDGQDEGSHDDDDDDWVEETVTWGSHVDPSDRWDEDAVFDGNEKQGPLTHYACAINDTYSVMGLPALDDDTAYLGHFANDGAGHIALGQGDPSRGVEESIASYVIESIDTSNAMHKQVDGLHMATVATRTIAVGEEILVTYGPDYWLEIAT